MFIYILCYLYTVNLWHTYIGYNKVRSLLFEEIYNAFAVGKFADDLNIGQFFKNKIFYSSAYKILVLGDYYAEHSLTPFNKDF